MISDSAHWLTTSSIYQINPRTFCQRGTINAVTEALPDLKKLGFKIIYLCPVFKEDDDDDKSFWSARQKASDTENPKNPYRMNDYFEIDSEYGTMDDLKRFVATGHSLGMKVILDLVYLHIGPNADILKLHPEFAAQNADGSNKLTDWNFPYLNYDNEGLREYLYCNMTYYIGLIDADGFRCDVGDGVPLDFWREGRRRIRAIKSDAIMINEGTKAEYLDVFDANYCFDWHASIFAILSGDITSSEVMRKHMALRELTPAGKFLLRDMDNHDTVTDWPYRIEAHYGNDAMELILALNYAIDGIPMVYCGNELADKTRISMFANRFHSGVFNATDRTVIGPDVERRKEVIKKLNGLRENMPVFAYGDTKWLQIKNDFVLAFQRVTDDETISFVGNFSKQEVMISASEPEIILADNNALVSDGKIILHSYGYIIVKGDPSFGSADRL